MVNQRIPIQHTWIYLLAPWMMSLGCTDEKNTNQADGLQFERVAIVEELQRPTGLYFLPGRPEFLVLTWAGTVYHYQLDAPEQESDMRASSATLLGSFEVPDVYADLDCGLLSLAIDPDFEDNMLIYTGQCENQTHNTIQRLRFDPEQLGYEGIAATAKQVYRLGDSRAQRPWHNVGSMGFDPEGALWAFFGDKTLRENGQDPSNDLGALIRLRPRKGATEQGYIIAEDNPFVDDDDRSDNIYAYGLRSPWMGLLDSSGRYWVGDVGDGRVEELNIITQAGSNLGWADHEGPCDENCDDLTQPIRHWGRGENEIYLSDDPQATGSSNRVVWAGLEYIDRGFDRYEGLLSNKVLYGDMCLGFIRAIAADEEGDVLSDAHVGHLANVSGWAQGPDGYIYAITFEGCTTQTSSPPGQLYRALLAN